MDRAEVGWSYRSCDLISSNTQGPRPSQSRPACNSSLSAWSDPATHLAVGRSTVGSGSRHYYL